jgi:hypothetical protein
MAVGGVPTQVLQIQVVVVVVAKALVELVVLAL